MRRIDAIRAVVEELNGELVVCNIGFPSRELYSVKDRDANFYMLGSMGLASSIGLGLALSTERQVVVFDGDGSLLMNLGSLVTIANQAPRNLTIIALDNGSYASTGGQPSYTAGKTNLAEIARSAGFENVFEAETVDELREAFRKAKGELSFILAKVERGNADVPVIPLSPYKIKRRFMEFIRGERC
ncbi:MAG: sulfopyruvate decarboxylase subunit beta [Candidatus Freyarchaeota archaeon]|nr:sulfopyruvate decarboxylase subunit beta [Candidatus Freyrarchaeum guaymaensis]